MAVDSDSGRRRGQIAGLVTVLAGLVVALTVGVIEGGVFWAIVAAIAFGFASFVGGSAVLVLQQGWPAFMRVVRPGPKG